MLQFARAQKIKSISEINSSNLKGELFCTFMIFKNKMNNFNLVLQPGTSGDITQRSCMC